MEAETNSGKDLGYYFFPRQRRSAPGHPRLDIELRSEPSFQHFDPEYVRLVVAAEQGGTEMLKLYHPWPYQPQYRVCVGRVILQDRKGKEVEAFTYGGDLQLSSTENLTSCVLTSPAPILELIESSSTAMMLAGETEILLARIRAKYLQNLNMFESRLTAVDPLALYFACLNTLKEKFENLEPALDSLTQRFVRSLQLEIETLRKRHAWPLLVPTIDQLFSRA